jgi:hypothetical protein
MPDPTKPHLGFDAPIVRSDQFGHVVLSPIGAGSQGLVNSVIYTRTTTQNAPVPLVAVHNGPIDNGLPNGFFVEDLIAIASHRIGTLNSQFACAENDLAVKYLALALSALDERTERVARERARQG